MSYGSCCLMHGMILCMEVNEWYDMDKCHMCGWIQKVTDMISDSFDTVLSKRCRDKKRIKNGKNNKIN